MTACLPNGWADVALGDVVSTSSGGTPSSKNASYYGGDIPWVKIGDLTEGFVTTTEQCITEAGLAASSARWLPEGTILMAMYGSIGKLGVLGMPATTNQAICALQPSEAADAEFLLWFLRSQREKLTRLGRGGAQANIGQRDVKALRMPLPPRDEQRRIALRLAELCTGWQAGREAFRRALAGVTQFRRACLAEAFSSPERVVELGDVGFVQSGLTKGRSSGDDLVELPYVRTANVQALYLDLGELKTLRVTPQQREKHMLRPGDVLVLEGGDADKVGRGWLWSGELTPCLHQNHVFAVRTSDELLPKYLAYFINAPQARRYFLSCAKQTVNLASINQTQLRELPVPLSIVREQQRVVERLDNHMAAAASVETALTKQLARVAQLEAAVYRDAFSGRLCSDSTTSEASTAKKRLAVLVGE